MEKIQSAVEWLMNQITFEEDDENNPEGKGRFASFQDYVNLNEYFDKAIAMEKEQRKKDFFAGIKRTGEGWNGEYANGNAIFDIEEIFKEDYEKWINKIK